MFTYTSTGAQRKLSKKARNIVPYFYKERGVMLDAIQKCYIANEITPREYDSACRELSLKTVAMIEEVEQQTMANRIAGVEFTTMLSLTGKTVYIGDS